VALESITAFKEQMDALKEQEAVLRKGLTIFKIDQPPSREIAKLELVCTEVYIRRISDHPCFFCY